MALHASLLTVPLTLLLLNPGFAAANIRGAMNVHGLLQPPAREISINDLPRPPSGSSLRQWISVTEESSLIRKREKLRSSTRLVQKTQ